MSQASEADPGKAKSGSHDRRLTKGCGNIEQTRQRFQDNYLGRPWEQATDLLSQHGIKSRPHADTEGGRAGAGYDNLLTSPKASTLVRQSEIYQGDSETTRRGYGMGGCVKS